MPIFSNQSFTVGLIAIGITLLWITSCWIAYMYGRHNGHVECMNARAERRARRKPTRDGDIRVLKPVDSRKHYAKAESVRIVSTHAPRPEGEDIWM